MVCFLFLQQNLVERHQEKKVQVNNTGVRKMAHYYLSSSVRYCQLCQIWFVNKLLGPLQSVLLFYEIYPFMFWNKELVIGGTSLYRLSGIEVQNDIPEQCFGLHSKPPMKRQGIHQGCGNQLEHWPFEHHMAIPISAAQISYFQVSFQTLPKN